MPTAATAAVVVTLVLGLGSGATTPPLVLRVAATAPLVVKGKGFAPGEHVLLVVVTTRAQQTRASIASAKGRLTVRFKIRVRRCAALTVRAFGSSGSVAVVQRVGSCVDG